MYYANKSVYYDEKMKVVEKMIKIGYCADNRKKSRTAKYKTENPRINPLAFVVGATKAHESFIHSKFSWCKVPDAGREWFYENDVLIEFINRYTTISSLDQYYQKHKYDYLVDYSDKGLLKRVKKNKQQSMYLLIKDYTKIRGFDNRIKYIKNKLKEFIKQKDEEKWLDIFDYFSFDLLFEYCKDEIDKGLEMFSKDEKI